MLINFNEMQAKTAPGMNGGTGKAICNGVEEELAAGVCHVCKKGSEHSIINMGDDDLVLITIVVER